MHYREWSIPPDNTRTEAPVLSCIDFINEPCFPIRLIAWVDATSNRIEQNEALVSSSFSENPDTRLNTLITASIAGERGASGSSFPEISTWSKLYKSKTEWTSFNKISYLKEIIQKCIKASLQINWSIKEKL